MFNANFSLLLVGDERRRYDTKVARCGCDPYEVVPPVECEIVPDISREDLIDYLVLKTDFLTLKQLKNFKSLEAHNYVTSGHVKAVTKEVNGKVIAFGKVRHSQSINDPPLKCWILIEKSGEILTAHCNCMAGAGDACSHVGALLFFLEYQAQTARSTTCTSTTCTWLQPSERATMCRIKDCDFRSAGTKWKQMEEGTARPTKSKRSDISPLTSQDVESRILANIQGTDATILRVWDGFQQTEETSSQPTLPMPLRRLYDEKYSAMGFSELINHCENIFPTITITKQEAILLERATREQHQNPVWMEQRSGRVTASRMKEVCGASIQKPAVSLLKRICYPDAYQFSTPFTRKGIQDEAKILEEFSQTMSQIHHDFRLLKCGLVVNPKHPFLGASPDAVCVCSCHGGAVVEVKSISIDSRINTGLSENDQLLKNHKFHYQIQTQMLVCQLNRGYFVERKPNQVIVHQEIRADEEVHAEIMNKVVPFFKLSVLPELLCKYFSSERHILLKSFLGGSSCSNICICKKPPLAPMINCTGPNCEVRVFHKKCVGIMRNLKKWICATCSVTKNTPKNSE